jgi:hypothetical protein
MHAIVDTKRLVSDGIIADRQARTIEARAREAMVFLAANFLLCAGIVAATGGFIIWLGSPSTVSVSGLLFLGVGALILFRGSDLYSLFGNASALIGAGMLIGGASLALIENHVGVAGTVMAASGLIVAGTASLLLNAARNSAQFVTGAILLMGLAMHLAGVALLLDRESLSGASIGAFYLYATLAMVSADWLMDVGSGPIDLLEAASPA